MLAILSHFKFKSQLTDNRGEISYVEYSFQTVAVESLCYFLQVEVFHLSWESLERAFLLSPAGIWGPVMPSFLGLPASGMRLGSGAREA